MSDPFSPLDEAGAWWSLRRSGHGTTGLVLTVKRVSDHKHNEFRGSAVKPLIEKGVAWAREGQPEEEPDYAEPEW